MPVSHAHAPGARIGRTRADQRGGHIVRSPGKGGGPVSINRPDAQPDSPRVARGAVPLDQRRSWSEKIPGVIATEALTMAIYLTTLSTEADIGAIFGPADGFVVELEPAPAPTPDRGEPQFSASKQCWKPAISSCGARATLRDLISDRSGDWMPSGSGRHQHFDRRASAFNGAVGWSSVRSARRAWSVDAQRRSRRRAAPRYSDSANFGSFPDWRHSRWPTLPREAV